MAPSAAKGKRRVDFCAPVPASKRVWVVTGIGAGWLRELARGEREAREAGAVAAAKAEGEVARGLSLFGGASSEVRRCNCSVVY